jgi:deazaflavin-dependent oxidoreductase (nitroreductase family)
MAEDYTTLMRDVTAKLMTGLHEGVFRATKGRTLNTLMGMPVLLVTTTGRKTHEPRSVMLTTPLIDDDRIVLVASNGGSDQHPAWYHNVCADPQVTVLHDGAEHRLHAHVADEAEHDELWPLVKDRYPGYAWYQDKTDRRLPLVIVERR